MWVVKNLLRATLVLEDLGVRIAAGDYYDLDGLGREKVIASNSARIAFEEGYLVSVKHDGELARWAVPQSALFASALSTDELSQQVQEIKQLMSQKAQVPQGDFSALGKEIKEAMGSLTSELLSGLKDQMKQLAQQRAVILQEKKEILQSGKLNDTEIKARLALLDSKEKEIKSNLEELGNKIGTEKVGTGEADALADLLGDL